MRRGLGAGVVAGVAGAVVCGLLLAVMGQLTVDGLLTPMLLLSRALHVESPIAVWLVLLGFGAVLGLTFAMIAGRRYDAGRIASIGFCYVLGLWAVLSLAVLPLLLHMTPLEILNHHEAWPWLPGMMVVALAYAGIMTATFTALRGRDELREVGTDRDIRRAA